MPSLKHSRSSSPSHPFFRNFMSTSHASRNFGTPHPLEGARLRVRPNNPYDATSRAKSTYADFEMKPFRPLQDLRAWLNVDVTSTGLLMPFTMKVLEGIKVITWPSTIRTPNSLNCHIAALKFAKEVTTSLAFTLFEPMLPKSCDVARYLCVHDSFRRQWVMSELGRFYQEKS